MRIAFLIRCIRAYCNVAAMISSPYGYKEKTINYLRITGTEYNTLRDSAEDKAYYISPETNVLY